MFDPATVKPAYQFSRPTLDHHLPTNNSSTDVPSWSPGGSPTTGRSRPSRSRYATTAPVSGGTPATATWTATQTWGFAPYRGTPTDAQWSWTFAGPQYGRTYHVEARARDTDNSLSSPVRTVDVRMSKPDGVAPQTVLASPAKPSTLPMGAMAMSGTATDNTGVTGVKYSVQHQRSAQWWTGSAWSTTQTWFNAPCEPGCDQHRLERVVDAAERRAATTSTRLRSTARGNQDATPADTDVTAQLASPDTTPANAPSPRPRPTRCCRLGQLTFTGKATDDTGVGWADVAIQNRDTGLWWNDVSDLWGPFTWNNGESTPATRWASPTAWSYAYTRPPPATTGSAYGRATTTAASMPRRPG